MINLHEKNEAAIAIIFIFFLIVLYLFGYANHKHKEYQKALDKLTNGEKKDNKLTAMSGITRVVKSSKAVLYERLNGLRVKAVDENEYGYILYVLKEIGYTVNSRSMLNSGFKAPYVIIKIGAGEGGKSLYKDLTDKGSILSIKGFYSKVKALGLNAVFPATMISAEAYKKLEMEDLGDCFKDNPCTLELGTDEAWSRKANGEKISLSDEKLKDARINEFVENSKKIRKEAENNLSPAVILNNDSTLKLLVEREIERYENLGHSYDELFSEVLELRKLKETYGKDTLEVVTSNFVLDIEKNKSPEVDSKGKEPRKYKVKKTGIKNKKKNE